MEGRAAGLPFLRAENMSIQYDMTKGPMAGQMFRFAFPLMLTYVLQTGYGAADMLIVSRFAGE